MAAGPLRERVRFERRSEVSDGAGNHVANWASLIAKRWAQIRPLRGGEEVVAAKLQSAGLVEVWVRSDPDTRGVRPDDRIVDLSNTARPLNIRYIENPDQRDKMLKMVCEYGVASG